MAAFSRRALASLSTLLAFQAGAVPRLVEPTNGEWTSPPRPSLSASRAAPR
ncbi:MAG: hypothetical protein IT380_16660 [Myxococcales bacterium]|nr:hypothetical protein [Myxococcales bacterium]